MLTRSQGWLSSGQIEVVKWLAIFFMVIDHVGLVFFHDQGIEPLFRIIGRISFPLFAFLVAYNLTYHCRNFQKYLVTLAVLGFVSYIPHELAFPTVDEVNIMFTLALGSALAMAVSKYQENPDRRSKIDVFFASLFALVGGMVVEYGHAGILLIPTLVLWLKHRDALSFLLVMALTLAANKWAIVWGGCFLSLPLVLWISQKDVGLPRTSKWVYYAFYPAHLLVLYGVFQFCQ